jgi:outer membrane protein insertion porin family
MSAALLACAGMAVCVSTALAVQPAAPQPPTPPAAAAAGEAVPDAPTLNPALAPFQGRVIRQVTVIGLKTVDETLVRNQIRAAMGEPLDESVVREDIQRLNRLGRFRDISARVQPYDDRSVELIYEMGETPIIVDVQAVGNRQISDQELAGEVNILAGTPVDRFQIDRTLRRIKELYLKKGYYQADVQVEEETLEKQGILVFRIREGERLRVTDLRFSGNAAFPAGRLRPNVKTKTWGIFNSGALDDTVLDQDVAALIQFYKDRGYLDVRIDRIIRPSPDAREAIITFIIEEGSVYTLRTVRAELDEAGALSGKPPTVFTPEQIAGLMSIKAGDVYSLDKIRKSVDAVRQSYEQLGYVDIQIQRIEVREPDQPRVDLLLAIREGRQFNTGAVIIKGNELTQQKVVRREVRLEPDRPLDATELTRAQERLEQSRIFDPREIRITIQPEDPANPGTRDVLTQIKETNTASLSFGAAVNSDAGVIGTIELRQRNFDLFDTPDSLDELLRFRAFRGAGQQFSILAQPGTETQNYSISLGEPSLFDTDYSGSIGGGFRSREFDDYLEERLGANTAIGRRFGDRWAGSLTLRGDRVTVSDVNFRPSVGPTPSPGRACDSAERI